MKTLQGVVISTNTPLTAKVSVEHQWQHPLYKKSVTRSKTYACGISPKQELQAGDRVVIAETKPLSKTKRFKVIGKQGK